MSTRLYLLSLAAASSLVVSGCSSLPANNQTGGTIIGGATGALIGSQFGGGRGAAVGAGVGAVGGALVGSAIGKNMDDQQRAQSYRNDDRYYDRGRRDRYDDMYGY